MVASAVRFLTRTRGRAALDWTDWLSYAYLLLGLVLNAAHFESEPPVSRAARSPSTPSTRRARKCSSRPELRSAPTENRHGATLRDGA